MDGNILKPCPFCGGKIELVQHSTDSWGIQHNQNCPMQQTKAVTMAWRNKDLVIENINTRPIEDALMREVERLHRELHNFQMAYQYANAENGRVRLALMPILDSEDPVEEIEQLRAKAAELEEAQDRLRHRFTRCTFCGFTVNYDSEDGHAHAVEEMNRHALVCPADPRAALLEPLKRFVGMFTAKEVPTNAYVMDTVYLAKAAIAKIERA